MSLDVYLTAMRPTQIFDYNITHNLGGMAEHAGLYEVLWHPENIGIKKAKDLIEPLREGLKRLLAGPDYFKKFNPPNGWGDYDGLVNFVTEYLSACEKNPDAQVSVSR